MFVTILDYEEYLDEERMRDVARAMISPLEDL